MTSTENGSTVKSEKKNPIEDAVAEPSVHDALTLRRMRP
jgi:hypothetical protein